MSMQLREKLFKSFLVPIPPPSADENWPTVAQMKYWAQLKFSVVLTLMDQDLSTALGCSGEM